MTQKLLSFPKQWEDWASWILGISLLLSPWALFFEYEPTAVRNAVVLGLLIILVEVVELSVFRDWEEWINIILGTWLVASPGLLGLRALRRGGISSSSARSCWFWLCMRSGTCVRIRIRSRIDIKGAPTAVRGV